MEGMFFFATASKPTLGPTQPRSQWANRCSFPGR